MRPTDTLLIIILQGTMPVSRSGHTVSPKKLRRNFIDVSNIKFFDVRLTSQNYLFFIRFGERVLTRVGQGVMGDEGHGRKHVPSNT